MKLKELKKGDYFTLKPIAEPTDKQVYIKGDYDKAERKYDCGRFHDISLNKYISGDTIVYTDFTF